MSQGHYPHGTKRPRDDRDDEAVQRSSMSQSTPNSNTFFSSVTDSVRRLFGYSGQPASDRRERIDVVSVNNGKRRFLTPQPAEGSPVPGSFPDDGRGVYPHPAVSADGASLMPLPRRGKSKNIWNSIGGEVRVDGLPTHSPRSEYADEIVSSRPTYFAHDRNAYFRKQRSIREHLILGQTRPTSHRKSGDFVDATPSKHVHFVEPSDGVTLPDQSSSAFLWAEIKNLIQPYLAADEDRLGSLELSTGLTISEKLQRRADLKIAQALKERADLAVHEPTELEEEVKEEEEEVESEEEESEEPEVSPSPSPLIRLPDEHWLEEITRIRKGKDDSDQVAEVEGLQLSRSDMKRLIESIKWLNDNSIEAFLKAMCTAANIKLKESTGIGGDTPAYHFFNPNFYRKVAEDGVDSVARWAKRAKINGTNLLKVHKLFIPMNTDNSHWTMLVISPKARTIRLYNSYIGCGPNKMMLETGKKFIQSQLGSGFREGEWSIGMGESSQQTNGSDCGVWTCFNALALLYSDEPAELLPSVSMMEGRLMFAAVLLNGGFKENTEFDLDGIYPGLTLQA